MKDYVAERVVDVANYVIAHHCTIRDAAKVFFVSKSTAHKDLSVRLPCIDKNLHKQVEVILNANWQQRHIRGGLATKNKYKQTHAPMHKCTSKHI